MIVIYVLAIKKSARGYPKMNRKGYYLVSRYIWFLNNGHINRHQHILHHCDNPACVNIDHIFIGNNSDNIDDKMSKKRQARHSHLTDKEIFEIKLNIEDTSQKLSDIYGVSQPTIVDIWGEKTHKYVSVENYEEVKRARKNRYDKKRHLNFKKGVKI